MASFIQTSLCTMVGSRKNSSRTCLFHVSCNQQKPPPPPAAVDRRKLLLSFGGLYGAANLQARADPIMTDFSSCFDDDTNCCPPGSGAAAKPPVIVDFRDLPPPPPGRRLRKAAENMTEKEIEKYRMAVQEMRNLDVKDPNDPRGFMQQANVHCAYCDGGYEQLGYKDLDVSVHFSWMFFPFHRWYLFFHERILGELIGDDAFALPYWNWDNPPGMPMPPMYLWKGSALYDDLRDNPDPKNPNTVVDLSLDGMETDPSKIIANNLSRIYDEVIGGVTSAYDFMGQPFRAGEAVPPKTDSGTMERGAHTGVHAWVGQDLGSFSTAARDPAFYAHHSNVDRMWAIWGAIPEEYPKMINDPDFLNTSFLFYDEKKRLVRVTIADCLDHTKLGYDFEDSPTPWRSSAPPKRAAPINLGDIMKGALSADKPFTLDRVQKVLVSKVKPGKANEVLVLENIATDTTKLVKFDVFVNYKNGEPYDVSNPEYLGTLSQLPMKHHHSNSKERAASQRFKLKRLYDRININNADKEIVVTIVPRSADTKTVTIGSLKIVADSA